MSTDNKLEELFSSVYYEQRYSAIEGLEPFRNIKNQEEIENVVLFLERKLPLLKDEIKSGIIFVIAEYYYKNTEIKKLLELYNEQPANLKCAVLNALWELPAADVNFRNQILEMAITGLKSNNTSTRAEACRVIQNHAAYGIDVSRSVELIESLLQDKDEKVSLQAECVIGNLAKRKYSFNSSISLLQENLENKSYFVRQYAAWALWQLTRYNYDISKVIDSLCQSLVDIDTHDQITKNAIGALLNFSKNSQNNLAIVMHAISKITLDLKKPKILKFMDNLNKIKIDNIRIAE